MTLFFGESDDFIFNARAIPRAYAVNLARIERGTAEVIKNNLLCFLSRISNITRLGVFNFGRVGKGKLNYIFIAELRFKLFKIHASAVNSRRSARFEPSGLSSEVFQSLCKPD